MGIDPEQRPDICCENLFSDVLYRPFLCTYTSLVPYTTEIPPKNAIPRLENLSPDDFSRYWNDRPFILERPVKEWPVYKSWDLSSLVAQYGDTVFRAEAVDWPLNIYLRYMRNSADESPLYLFDRDFVEKMGLKVGKDEDSAAYWIPECFGEDLFSVLGDKRPDSRWLIVGPARSGSTFHKDPNATSAWNAVLRGSKYWIMFPSKERNVCPPGVFVSEDQSEVTSPLSIAEWLLGFHEEARRTSGCMEGICAEGEILHVPSGWWHLVVNLEPSVAITQNFVPRSHLSSVLSFLKDKPGQVSGFRKDVANPFSTFVDCMAEQHPDLLGQALEELDSKAVGQKRKWDVAIGDRDGRELFSFGFGDGESDEEMP